MLRFPRLLFFLTAALICVGGWMVFNAKSVYDPDFLVLCRYTTSRRPWPAPLTTRSALRG